MTSCFYPLHPVLDPDRLDTLDAYGLSAPTPDTGLDGIAMLARTLCGAPTALISLVGQDRQWFAARSGFGPSQTPLSQSVCVHALEQPGLLIITDLTTDSRTRGNSLVTGAPLLRFYAGAPLRTADGKVLGTLCVLDTVSRPAGLSGEQAEGLQTLATQIMMQLELRRRLAASEAEVARLRSARLPAA